MYITYTQINFFLKFTASLKVLLGKKKKKKDCGITEKEHSKKSTGLCQQQPCPCRITQPPIKPGAYDP